MTTKVIVEDFNDIVSAFLKEVSSLIGTTYYIKFDQLIKYNSSLPIEQFIVYAFPIRDHIESHDIDYFIDSKNITSKFDTDDDSSLIEEIFNFRKFLKAMDDESISNIWDMLSAMLILCDNFLEIKLNKS